MLPMSLSSCLLQVFESKMDGVWMETPHIKSVVVHHLPGSSEYLRI